MQTRVIKRRKYFETAARVVAAFDRTPTATSVEIGERLGLHPAYVRKALTRNGRCLKRSHARKG